MSEVRQNNTEVLLGEMGQMENVEVDDVCSCVQQVSELDLCRQWLQNECPICTERFPESKVSLCGDIHDVLAMTGCCEVCKELHIQHGLTADRQIASLKQTSAGVFSDHWGLT